VRLLGAIASFSQGVPQGMQYLNTLNAADASERANLADAAARGWTPEEYRTRTGQPVPPGQATALQARDMPISKNPNDPQATPSMPERQNVIQFPNTPEELTAARDAELMNRRSMENYGVGVSREQAVAGAEQAQRMKHPLDASEKTVLAEDAMNSLPSGQYKNSFTFSDEGMQATSQYLPPEDQSMDMETYDRVKVPSGWEKIPIPDQQNAGRMYMKIVNTKTGMDFWDAVGQEAQRTGRPPLEIAKDFYTGRGAGPKLGSPAATLTGIQEKIQRELTPEEVERFLNIRSMKTFKPEDKDKAMQKFLVDIGYKQDPVEMQAADQNAQRAQEIEAQLRAEREGRNQPTAPSGPSTPSFPNAGATPGRPAMTPGGPAATEVPNAPPVKPAPLPRQQQLQKQRTFNELKPDDLDTAATVVLDSLAKSGPDAAVSKLAAIVGKFSLSEAEKEMLAFSVIQGLRLPESSKAELHRKVEAEIH